MKGNYPQYLSDNLKENNNSVYNTRNTNQTPLINFRARTEKSKNRTGSRLSVSVLEKTQLVSFDWFNNTGAIDVKMDKSVLEEK